MEGIAEMILEYSQELVKAFQISRIKRTLASQECVGLELAGLSKTWLNK
jgi:hypothetical protein